MSLIDKGDGPAVLLGHGYLWDWSMWAPQIEALAQHNRVIVPEMWGHGGSGPLPRTSRTLSDLAGHMTELLDKLQIERCAVIGLSMGGMWGAHLAATAPDRVAGLVIMNSFLGEEPEASRTTYEALLDSIEREGRFPEAVIDAALPLFFAPDIGERSPGLSARLQTLIESFSEERVRDSIVPLGRLIFNRENGLHALRQLSCPHLIVAGASDLARSPAESIAMADILKSKATLIDGSGHTSSLEQADKVNEILGSFLAEIGWRR